MVSMLRRNFWRVAALLMVFPLALFFYFFVLEFLPGSNLQETGIIEISIREALLRVGVASTPILRARGLSGRDSLARDAGMLFTFDKPGFYSFWMKDMRFPIDIIWLRDKKIVYIAKNVSPPGTGVPDSKLKVYSPPVEADMVLEVNAGIADRFHIEVNDSMTAEIKKYD
ncbi:MAG: DUF192 domain-containing protein [Candidatus Sungbacteria bacterium]|nr:DUF192 domain-containing protein [Candidatus Sungbacteria bacterium]